METMLLRLFSVTKRREIKISPWITFDQTKKQQTLDEYVRSDTSQAVLIPLNAFICIVPLYDFEYRWLVKKKDPGFNISDIVNAIIRITIGMYKMDIYMNPKEYNCTHITCAEDVAQGYVLSNLYKIEDDGKFFIWFDVDH